MPLRECSFRLINKSIEGIDKMGYEIKDEHFTIDFLYVKDEGKTLKNVDITFQAKNQYIMINGDKRFFNTAYIREEGMSKDNLYHKISTPDFVFWILPSDYNRFKEVLNHRHNILVENKKARLNSIHLNNEKTVEYDEIDGDIYNCFIAYKSGMTEEIGTWEKFYRIEKEIEKECLKNGGKYYKNEAKRARFAIIFSYTSRVYTCVNELREKGYKVTTFEKALEYFGLSKMWNCDLMVKKEEEYKKFMKKHYKKV